MVLTNPQCDLTQGCNLQKHRVKLNVISLQETNLCPQKLTFACFILLLYIHNRLNDPKILEDAKSKNCHHIHFHF